MAKRGTYVYDYQRKQGYLLSLRTVIKKLMMAIDLVKDLPPRHSKVIEMKDQFVRLARLYNTLKEDMQGRMNLRVGDVSSFRTLRTDLYPEVANFKADLRNASILSATESAGIDNLFPEAKTHLLGPGSLPTAEAAANMDFKWDPNDSD